jgi:hypothetical protein
MSVLHRRSRPIERNCVHRLSPPTRQLAVPAQRALTRQKAQPFSAFLSECFNFRGEMNLVSFLGMTSQAAEKLVRAVGRDFSPSINTAESMRALQAAEKLDTEGGGGFNPRIKPTESTSALAAEGRFPRISFKFPSSSAAYSVVPRKCQI